jgi:hypothetical protein
MKEEYDFSEARRGAVVKTPPSKVRITIRIDEDIIEWFRSRVHAAGGGNYQTLINAALREHTTSKRRAGLGTLRKMLRAELEGLGRRGSMNIIEQATDYLAEERYKIRLHALVADQVKGIMSKIGPDQFPAQRQLTVEETAQRLKTYEAITSEILGIQALLAYWGLEVHHSTLSLAPKRIGGSLKPEAGLTVLIALRWYPVLLLLYAGGISAVAGAQYGNLRRLMNTTILDSRRTRGEATLIHAVTAGLSDALPYFKHLPAYSQRHTPLNDYLFDLLKPLLDTALYLGAEYESHFDRFEVLFALQCAHEDRRGWGPMGRFAWKLQSGEDSSPLDVVIKEAEAEGDSWEPLKAGLFGGSGERFKEVASSYRQMVMKLGWY